MLLYFHLVDVACLLGPERVTILEHKTFNAVKTSGMMNPPMTHPCDPALAHSWK